MRKIQTAFWALCFALLTSFPSSALAQSATTPARGGDFGLGILLGDPTGITGKVWVARDNAFDFGAAWSFGDYFSLYGDYLWHFHGAFGSSTRFLTQLSPYVGVGAVIAFASNVSTPVGVVVKKRYFFGTSRNDSFGVGIRIPVGIEWRPAHPPLGVLIELAPGMSIAPSTSAFFMGGVGARYYF